MKEKQIQISEALFTQMCAYILMPEFNTPETLKGIKEGINDKIDHIQAHELYTAYKTAPTEAQKEKARKEYLEKRGIHPDFQW